MGPGYHHWAYRLANEVIERNPNKQEYVILSGATTSGTPHLGTVCEFLFPYAIKKALEDTGRKAKMYFVLDILDAFDKVPSSVSQYETELAPHLGKPLERVPDPTGTAPSLGEYFYLQMKAIMDGMGIEADVVKASGLYEKGIPVPYAKMSLDKIELLKQIIKETSGRELKKGWTPIMPICDLCGKIATTRVTSFDKEYNCEYACDAKLDYVEGCGNTGKFNLSEPTKYKMVWRLEWAARQAYMDADIEGAGVDHFTKGGSWDTAIAIHRQMFQEEKPLIGYKYGFVLLEGRKFSKSKGNGMGMAEMVKLIPPKVIAYHLLKFDLEENINFNPQKESMLAIIEDYEAASKISGDPEGMSKADVKKHFAYRLSGKREWACQFRDMLMYYEIFRDWGNVRKNFPGASDPDINAISPYIEEWIARDFVPDDYSFTYRPAKAEGAAREFLESLDPSKDADGIHNAIYEFAKAKGIPGGEMFKALYRTLLGKERGPRLGKLIYAIGAEKVKRDAL
jgi:lysyl-tRNA synthetase class 1